MDYSFTYDCIYKASGFVLKKEKSNIKIPINIKLKHAACFADIYNAIRYYAYADITYDIYLYKENIKGKNFNLCDKLETKKILRCLKKTVDFEYKFKKSTFTLGEYNKKQCDFNVLSVHIKGPWHNHFWITTMLRCFFEYPYNVAAKEACELQSKMKVVDGMDLSRHNWLNLYLTIAAKLGSSKLHGFASLNHHPYARTYIEWKNLIKGLKGNTSIYDYLTENTFSKNNMKFVDICDDKDYEKNKQSRASKYVLAYKDKLSWKNK